MPPSCLPPPTKFQSNLTTTNPLQPLTHRRAGVTTSRPIGITDTTRPPGKQKSLGNTGQGNFKLSFFGQSFFLNERSISFCLFHNMLLSSGITTMETISTQVIRVDRPLHILGAVEPQAEVAFQPGMFGHSRSGH